MGRYQDILSRRLLVTIFLGFSSGLPLLATGGTLQAWLTESGVDLATVGALALVGLPYTLKFLWAPLLDRFTLPFLDRRRGWMLVSQFGLMLSLAALGYGDPIASPFLLGAIACTVSFLSATQDIVLDAHRRDTLRDEELGLGSALFVNGYRIGMLASGAFALFLADHISWRHVYLCLAALMLVGMVFTLLAPPPGDNYQAPRSIKEAIVNPFVDYFSRSGALIILAFILLYKVGDSMASNLTTPFILQLGFSKTELASIVKTFGLAATIVGSLVGGAFMIRLGIGRSLWIFGTLQAVSTAGFAWLAGQGHSLPGLAAVIAFENLSGGMGTAAYAAFMASLCNKSFSATQYALLSSLMGVPRVLIATPTGFIAQQLGWQGFFVVCTLAALPGMVLLLWVAPWSRDGIHTGRCV